MKPISIVKSHLINKIKRGQKKEKSKQRYPLFGLKASCALPGLAYSMASILCLSVHGRVPVTVIEYNCVSSSQVNAYTPRPGAEDHTEHLVILVKPLHQLL